MNVLRLYERKNARKMCGPVEGGECWRIVTRRQDKVHVKRERCCKIYKIPLTVMVWSC
jgi:hypothetical protein